MTREAYLILGDTLAFFGICVILGVLFLFAFAYEPLIPGMHSEAVYAAREGL